MLNTAEKRENATFDDVGAFDHAGEAVKDAGRSSGGENIAPVGAVIFDPARSFVRHVHANALVYDGDYDCGVDDRLSGVAGVRLAVGTSVMLWGIIALAGWYMF